MPFSNNRKEGLIMNDTYEQAFRTLLKLVIDRKQQILKNHNSIKSSVGSILKFGDNLFGEYDSMVKSDEKSAVSAIEAIAVSLVAENHLQEFDLYPIKQEYKSLSIEEQVRSKPFQLIKKESNKKIGIVFSLLSDAGYHYKKLVDNQYDVDHLQIVLLIDPDEYAYKTIIKDTNDFNLTAGIPITRITIKQFWETNFGTAEYLKLISHIEEFNAKISEVIGFQTVLSPTEEALENFKIKIGEELRCYQYINFLPKDIFTRQIEILCKNYLERNLWRAMIGKSSFALSFITSEWYYKVYQLSENLDLTNVVAGYLKSIEQLLFAVINLSKDNGLTMLSKDKYNKDARIVCYTEATEDLVDTTLGALQNAISHNWQILDVSKYVKDW